MTVSSRSEPSLPDPERPAKLPRGLAIKRLLNRKKRMGTEAENALLQYVETKRKVVLEQRNGTWKPGRRVVKLLAAWICGTATAGTVYQSAIVVSPQMQMREGEVDGCGFQFKSLPTNLGGEKVTMMLDVSLNLYSGFYAGMKGGASQISMTRGTPSSRKVLPISSFWLKAEGQKSTKPKDGKVMPSDDPGYLLYLSDFTPVVDLFYAVLEGKQLSLGVHVKGESVERIYTGVPSMDDAERAQSNQCMVELLERVETLLRNEERKSQPKQ